MAQEWNEQEIQFRSALAKALWKVENKSREFSDNAGRNDAYKGEKSEYIQKANQIMRQLKLSQASLG